MPHSHHLASHMLVNNWSPTLICQVDVVSPELLLAETAVSRPASELRAAVVAVTLTNSPLQLIRTARLLLSCPTEEFVFVFLVSCALLAFQAGLPEAPDARRLISLLKLSHFTWLQ